MINIYQTDQRTGHVMEISSEIIGGMDLNNKWIHLTNPTDQEIELVARATGVSEDTIKGGA